VKLAEPYTFFVDRSLGGAFVAGALRQAGHAVVVHDDEFEPDARDVDCDRRSRRAAALRTKDILLFFHCRLALQAQLGLAF
jgi:hypothetical protein